MCAMPLELWTGELQQESEDEASMTGAADKSDGLKEGASVETPVKSQKSKSKRGLEEGEKDLPSQKKGRPAAKGKAGKKKLPESEQWRKCQTCRRWRQEKDFYAAQASCAACSLNLKSMRRIAASQGSSQWLRELESKDAEGFATLVEEYTKQREERCGKRCRTNFSFASYKEAYIASAGTRTEAVGEMMWRGEFIEFAKGPKMGYLTEQEASLRWDELLQNKKLKRDDDGPRGNVRLWVKTKDQVIGYLDASKQRRLEQEERISKKATEEQLKKKLGQVFQEGAGSSAGLLTSDELMDKAMMASATVGNDRLGVPSTGFQDGLLREDLRDILSKSQACLRVGFAKQSLSDKSDFQGSTVTSLDRVGCTGLMTGVVSAMTQVSLFLLLQLIRCH